LSLIEKALEEEKTENKLSRGDVFIQGEERYFQRLILATMALCML
jgi:hypothetical protein